MKYPIRFLRLLLAASTCHLFVMTTPCLAFTAGGMPSLSDDYAAAQQRRALEEEELLSRPGGPMELPCYDSDSEGAAVKNKKPVKTKRPSGGAGFGGGASSSSKAKMATRAQKQTAASMAAVIRRDGVIRLPSVLSPESCIRAREHVLKLKSDVLALSETDPSFDPKAYYGVEPGRTCRTDLLLPLDSVVQATLSELLAASSPLRHLYCELLPLNSPLYEIAAVITTTGSHRQMIHPDLPFQKDCPLYVVFCALQDVTPDMGPTTFLRGTQDDPLPCQEDMNQVLENANVVIGSMKRGDVVVFDARVLHCGNANVCTETTRALFNFSFRHPDSGPLGYEGSIRKGYIDVKTLGELLQVSDNLNGWGSDGKTLESEHGDGLL
eukprot:scaffold1123_cov168-Amphora_coffeaeformis.AAC.32